MTGSGMGKKYSNFYDGVRFAGPPAALIGGVSGTAAGYALYGLGYAGSIVARSFNPPLSTLARPGQIAALQSRIQGLQQTASALRGIYAEQILLGDIAASNEVGSLLFQVNEDIAALMFALRVLGL
jgi:hypothetical protein